MIGRALALCLGASLLIGAASPADTLPDVATVRTQMLAATGTMPRTYTDTIVQSLSVGSDMTTVTHRRGDDFRTITTQETFHIERGRVKGQSWHQNANGLTVLEEPDPIAPVPEKSTTTVTRQTQPFAALIVSAVNAAGYGVREYVDPATYHIVRTVAHSANGDSTVDYDDYRTVGAATIPFHWKTHDDIHHVSAESKRTSFITQPVPDSALAMPAIRRDLVEFPAGVRSVDVPMRLIGEHVVVRVTIGGRGLDFLLDTGASGITIDAGVVHELGLDVRDLQSAVAAGSFQSGIAVVPEMHVGALTMRQVAVGVIPQRFHEGDAATVGLLGFDFLATLGVTVDYENHKLTVVPAMFYTPPAGPQHTTLPIRVGSQVPMTSASFNGIPAERVIIDTGGTGSFLLFDYFSRRHADVITAANVSGVSATRRLLGIGGVFYTRALRAQSFKMGTVTFKDIVGYRVVSSGAYNWGADGLIGPEIISLFTVGIDYADGRIDLVPNAVGRAAIEEHK